MVSNIKIEIGRKYLENTEYYFPFNEVDCIQVYISVVNFIGSACEHIS